MLFIYRIHESPDPAKIEKLSQTLHAIGMAVPKKLAEGEPAGLQQILTLCQGMPTERLVESLDPAQFETGRLLFRDKNHFGLQMLHALHLAVPSYPDLFGAAADPYEAQP